MYTYQQIKDNPEIISIYKSRELIPLKCNHCNTEHKRKKHNIQIAIIQNTKNNFCSNHCLNLFNNETRIDTKKQVKCLNCSETFLRPPSQIHEENNFCSRKCSSEFRKSETLKTKETFTCLECQSENYIKKSSTNTFCSTECFHKSNFKRKIIPRVEQGKVWDSKTLKKYLTHVHGYKCSNCNLNEWQNQPISLHCDHIDGNSDNNLPENLRLLCPNCHSQTETFTGRNFKNSKRTSYNQRYRKRKLEQ